MNDKEIRRVYRNAAEQQTPSPQLVNATLLKMHDELGKIVSEKEGKQERDDSPLNKIVSFFLDKKRQTRWMMSAGLACAAALCLFVFRLDAALQIAPIAYQEDIRMLSAYRSGNVEPLLPELKDQLELATQSVGTLKRTGYAFSDFSFDENAPVLWAAVSWYDAPVNMEVTVSSFQPMLLDTLSNASPNTIKGRTVYMGKDEKLGDCFALWVEENALYVQVRMIGGAGWNNREKLKAVEAVLDLPLGTI